MIANDDVSGSNSVSHRAIAPTMKESRLMTDRITIDAGRSDGNAARPGSPIRKPTGGRARRRGIVLVVLCAVVGIGYGVTHRVAPTDAESLTASLQVETVTKGTLEDTVSSTGTLQAVGTVDVSTQVSGTIAKVLVDFNSRVTKGQVLAELDRSIYEAQLRAKEANMARVEADVNKAAAEYERNRPLFDKGYISAQEFLVLETTLTQARASRLQAMEDLKQSKTNLDYTIIRSPIDGTVIERSIDEGQTVAASLSAPTLFIIAGDLAHMQIEASVDESDIARISTGQEVRFTVQSYTNRTFVGKVTQVRLNPTTVSNVVMYKVIVDAENKAGLLLPGMTATVDFIVGRAADALLVSNAAFQYKPSAELAALLPAGNARQEHNAGNPREHIGTTEPDEQDGVNKPQTLYSLNKDGRLEAVSVTTAITDGIKTAAPEGGALTEGMAVVVGVREDKKSTKSGGLTSFLKPPRGMGPPGR